MNKEKNIYLFILALFLFCISMSFVINTPDYDLWARLLVGKHIFETGSIMKTDIFSYTPTHFWYDHEWGSSIIFYTVFKYFGGVGLTLLKGGLIFTILFLISQIVKIRGVKTTTPYNIIFYICVFMSFYTVLAATVRCHLFTFLFFTLWLYLLERVRSGEKKWLFYLPFMMIFWSNIHGGCVSGIGLLVIYCIGEFLNKKPIKDYFRSLVLSCFAMFINPYGPKYVEFLLKATTMNRPLITEWKSTFDKVYMFDYIKFKIFMLIMALTVIIKSIKEKFNYNNVDKTKVLLLVVTASLSIAHLKHQPFFVIIAASFLYDDFYNIYNSLIDQIKKTLNITDSFSYAFVELKEIFVYGLIFLICLVTLATTDKKIKISQAKYPIFAIEFVKKNNIKGNLFVNFPYGSYAVYKLFPNNRIVMDGRYEEVYYDDLLIKLKDFHMAKKTDWKNILTEYAPTDVIILEKSYPAFSKLSQDKDWKMVFDDNAFGVFVPSKKVKTKYIYPTAQDSYYDSTEFNSNVDYRK